MAGLYIGYWGLGIGYWVLGIGKRHEVIFSIIHPCPPCPLSRSTHSLVPSPQSLVPSLQIFPLFPLYIIWGLSVGFSEAIAILYDQK